MTGVQTCALPISCAAELAQVSFGDGIRATLKISKTASSRHELADATGQTVVVVMARAEEFTQRMEEIKAQATQKDLFKEYEDRRWRKAQGGGAQPDPSEDLDGPIVENGDGHGADNGVESSSPEDGRWRFDGFDMFEWIDLLGKAGAIVTAKIGRAHV